MKHLILLSLIALATLSCSTKSSDNTGASFLDDCDVVAAKEVIDGDTVIVCDYKKVKQRKNVPLKELLTDFNVLKMDNENEEGLIGRRLTGHIIGEKYIAVFSYSFMPLKLYDKQGKFIRNIGKIGQGPDEYGVINNVYMDEKADRIYILAFDTDKVLVYDLKGNTYDYIPLAERVQYGNSIIVNAEKQELIVTKSPRKGGLNSVWMQDFSGNIIQAVKQADYFPDILNSESTITRLQTSNIEFFSLNGYNNNQYLYHYNMKENRLVPKFRMKNMDEYWIFVYELPRHFVVEVATSTNDSEDEYFTPKFIIDKYSLKGCFFDAFITPSGISLNQYDILFNARYGYFGLVDFGSYIDEKIQKVDKESLSSKSKKELEKLQQLIDETDLDDDCSLLFYGKFKQ